MARKTAVCMTMVAPDELATAAPLEMFAEVRATMDAVVIGLQAPARRARFAGAEVLPVLALRSQLFGRRSLEDVRRMLAGLVGWSADHPEWLVIGGTLEWTGVATRLRVTPVLYGGVVRRLLVDAPAGADVVTQLELGDEVRGRVDRNLAVVTIEEVVIAVEVDPDGLAGQTAYMRGHGGVGVDLHVVLRPPAGGSGVPRGHVGRDGGYVAVCHADPALAGVVRTTLMQHPDEEMTPRETVARLRRAPGGFEWLGAPGVYLWSEACVLPAEPPGDELRAQPLAASAGGLAALGGAAEADHADDVTAQMMEPLPPLEGLFAPTKQQVAALKAEDDVTAEALGDELRAATIAVWSGLPPEHVAGAQLDLVYRDVGRGQMESLYDGERAIRITVPFKARAIYMRMPLSVVDWMYMRMKGRAAADSCWGRSGSDRQLPHMELKLLAHTVRHELAHAICPVIGWEERRSALPQFGGWWHTKSHNDWIEAMIRGAAKDAGLVLGPKPPPPSGSGPKNLPEDPVYALFGMPWDRGTLFHALNTACKKDEAGPPATAIKAATRGQYAGGLYEHVRTNKAGTIWDEVVKAAVNEPRVPAIFERVCRALDQALRSPWWTVDGGGVVLDGRIYQRDYHGDNYSYLREAHARRVSNYQFANPSEWFAEAYAFYFAGPEGDGNVLRSFDAANADWFRDNLGPNGALLAPNGLRALA
ncbi:MAG: hypothetical protein JNL82_22390 [Myxococcales bacterium]|nr:hypothetical protein [Myxococcales bacterium]